MHLNFSILYIGSSTLGENFNPANDCSDIVDNTAGAKDGFYWIKSAKGKPLRVFSLRIFNDVLISHGLESL